MNLSIVVVGLSVTSSWGNGHATTYRALIEALARRGHQITFLERDVPWYRTHRDLDKPSSWRVELYQSLRDIPQRFGQLIRDANLVIVGSYVPDGIAISDWITSYARGIKAFYDIDTPVTLAKLDGGLDYLSAAMIPRFDLYLSFSGGPVPAMLEERYGSPLARVLYCSADNETYKPQQAQARWLLGYLGTYSEDRQPTLEQLLIAPARELVPEQFIVAGAQYPGQIRWPDNVQRIEHLTPQQHAKFYAEQRFTLNATRADMRSLGFSPSVRLFEAAACGTPVISDRWPGIETIFEPSREILLASTPRDVIQILRDMPEERRRAIAERARQRVLANHTSDHRARQLEIYYAEATARPRRNPMGVPAARSAQVAEL
ncbi:MULTISPECIES: glycosyltransferase [unclassified Bradyrhizobium]|uniref:CgeB family protein n=1 Tax=unclassified Bradyrhizobium TaxID=2631580 RepID=UPI0020B3B450|nr:MULTISPECIES: glycosyltransferase [unclassified Bradyrhizobium]MCP3402125.1 glycosyltransferase [Bradyrhizobium sp. CCGB20]MCP3410614.1 glycosyltransferase [Bradyrhizobium sp. CCGB01]